MSGRPSRQRGNQLRRFPHRVRVQIAIVGYLRRKGDKHDEDRSAAGRRRVTAPLRASSPTEDASPTPAKAQAIPPVRNAGLGRRLVFGFGAQALTMLVEIVQQILMVPLFLYSWGVGKYEDWLLIGAAANFTRLFDFGMEFHFGNALRLSLAAGDRAKFDRSLSIGMTCYAAVSLFLVASISIIAWLIDLTGLLNISTLSARDVSAILWLFIIQRVVLLPRPFIRSIYAAHGEFSRGENMYTVLTLGSSLTTAAMLLLGAQPVLVAFVSVFSALAFCWGIMITDQRRRYPDVRFRPAVPTRSELNAVIRNARLYLLPLWAEKVLLQGPVLMLGMFAREEGAVLMFTLSRTLTGLARMGAIQLSRSGGIEMARQVAQQDRKGAINLHRTLGRTIGGLTGLTCGLIWVAAEPIIAIWTGSRVPIDPLIVLAFVAGVLFAGPAQANFTLLQLTNTPRPLALSSLLQVILVIGLGLPLIAAFGALGSAVAVGFADALAFGVLINEAAARRFALGAERYAATAYGSEMAGLVLGSAVAWLLLRSIAVDHVFDLMVVFAIWGAVLALPSFFLLLDKSQRSKLLAQLRSMLRIRRSRTPK